MMKTEIISIGTELLMGYVVDTNSADIAKALLGMGIGTYYRQIVGDNPKRLEEAVEIAANRSDLIIMSGGLGPTKDDITKEVVATFVGDEVIEDEKQLEKILGYSSYKGEDMPANMHRQAYTLKNGTTFFNEVGLACGTAYKRQREDGSMQFFLMLPGPPFEMKHMLANSAVPYIQEHIQKDGVIESLYLNFQGVGESRVADVLDDYIEMQTNPTVAVYAKPRHVIVRLTANASDVDLARKLNQELADKMTAVLKPYFIGYGEDQTMEGLLVDTLKEKGLSISVVEDFTGGHIMDALTSIPGVSSIFPGGLICKTDTSKQRLLGVAPQTTGTDLVKELAERSRESFETDVALSVIGNIKWDESGHKGTGLVHIGLALHNREPIVKEYRLEDRPASIMRTLVKNEALAFVKDSITRT